LLFIGSGFRIGGLPYYERQKRLTDSAANNTFETTAMLVLTFYDIVILKSWQIEVINSESSEKLVNTIFLFL
jgi:hypothetical protein